jgi:hypothetical protein
MNEARWFETSSAEATPKNSLKNEQGFFSLQVKEKKHAP